jgi:hypothetical protein
MKNKLYFGQGCPYFVGWWEFEEKEEEDYKNKFVPILMLCTHVDNIRKDEEGNCNKDLCPLLKIKEESDE